MDISAGKYQDKWKIQELLNSTENISLVGFARHLLSNFFYNGMVVYEVVYAHDIRYSGK